MKDRLIIETKQLRNGIRVYSKPMDVPFVYIWLYIPVGHIHNTGSVLPGTAHFLEHIVCGRSHLYPEKDQFQKIVELSGGSMNASTRSLSTEYSISVPSNMFEKGFKGLLDHVFNPLIKSADVKHEASIILNESKRRNKWYPGDDEFEHHRMTKWKSVKIFEARQMTGNESDLSKMTPARLLKLHEAYFDPRVYVIIGGTFDKEIVYKELGKIKTKKHELQTKFEEIKWANKDYHEKKVDNISRFLYHMGGIFPEHDMSVGFAISFIGELLTNTTQGSLMEWLRNDLGWCYDLHLRTDFDTNPIMNNMWELFIPLNSRKQVDYVRKHIHKKILNAISDKKFVAKEVDRQISYRLFMFQTLGSIMNEVGGNLGSHGGKAYTETEYLKLLEKCKDTSYLREIYDKYMSPKVAGEFLAVPK